MNRNIQALRGCAIIMVLLCHLPFVYGAPGYLTFVDIFNFAIGVDLFFIISGYLMMATFFGKKDRYDINDALSFYGKRFRRIFLPTVFWATVLFIETPIILKIGNVGDAREMSWIYVSAISFLSNFKDALQPTAFGYFWSIALEAQFYLLLPAIFIFAPGNAWKVAIAAIAIMSLPLLVPVWAWHFRMNGLFMGMLAWWVVQRMGDVGSTLPRYAESFILPLYSVALMFAAAAVDRYMLENYKFTIISILMVVIFLGAVLSRRLVFGWFSRVLEWIGDISFSVYLCHFPVWVLVLWILRDMLHMHRDAYAPVGLIAVFVCGYLSRRYIEPLLDKQRGTSAGH